MTLAAKQIEFLPNSKKIFWFLSLFFILKIVYYLYVLCLPYKEYNRLKISFPGQYIFLNYSNNDSGWYQKIAENGYPDAGVETDQEKLLSYSFFPLYPESVRAFSLVTGLGSLVSFFIVSGIISLISIFVLILFVNEITGDINLSLFSTAVLILFPHNYYYSMYYTESLFLLLLVSCYYSILKNNFIILFVSAFLLSLTRVIGVLMIVPLIAFLIEIHFRNHRRINQTIRLAAGLTGSIISFGLWDYYLFKNTGINFAFKHYSELGWSGHPQSPVKTLTQTFSNPDVSWWFKYNGVYCCIFLFISLYFLFRRQYSYFLLSIIIILLPLYEGSTISQPRFISTVFPFFILFGKKIYSWRLKYLVLLLLFFLQLLVFTFWANTHPFSC